MDKEELIGQIIDIFEDDLSMRHKGAVYLKPINDNNLCRIVPVYQEDEDSNGVFYGGDYYDRVAEKIEERLLAWGLIKPEKKVPKLYVIPWEEKWCVSTSENECYCDEEIWLALGISENKFYEISRKHMPSYFHHTFDYGNIHKEVCDTSFSMFLNANSFADDLIKEAKCTK